MGSVTGGLSDLHDLHLELHARKKKLEAGPRQISIREKLVAKKQAEIDEHKEAITNLQKTADDKNLQFRTNEQEIVDLKGKLNQAASNKEFDIIKGQIAKDESANAALEDEYLELLEQVDTGRQELATLEEELKAAGENVASTRQTIESEKPQLDAEVAEFQKEMKEAEKCIPGELREMYRRLVQQYGPAALAPVEGGACCECFVEVSPQQEVELRAGRGLRCRSCGRVLYSRPTE